MADTNRAKLQQIAAQSSNYTDYLTRLAASGGTEGREAQALLSAGVTNDAGRVKNSLGNFLTNTIGGATGYYGAGQLLGYNERGQVDVDGYGYGAQGLGTLDGIYSGAFEAGKPEVGGGVYDPYAALRAQQTREAQEVKDRLLGRSGEVDTILAEIMGNIDSLVKDQKRVRDQQYGVDTRSLVDALGSSIPEIEKAFASLGLSNSTFVGDRRDDTSRQYQLSQESVDRQLASDLAEYGKQADSWRGQAQASADKAKNNLDYVRNSDATADNLNTFKDKESQFSNMLTDFGAQRKNFTTSGDALKDLQKIGSDYDFSKIMDSFGSMAASSANTGVGGTAPQAVLDSIRGIDPKKKNNKTEVDINNPVGAATF